MRAELIDEQRRNDALHAGAERSTGLLGNEVLSWPREAAAYTKCTMRPRIASWAASRGLTFEQESIPARHWKEHAHIRCASRCFVELRDQEMKGPCRMCAPWRNRERPPSDGCRGRAWHRPR